jgi:putative flavoprotein involved in K+ transport
MHATREPESVETVVIGGGQAGLSVGYHLAKRNRSFVILEANERIGDSWRQRWDSLRLFTPAWLDTIPGLPFPASKYAFPRKDEMADYLESYATHFALPVRTGVRVDRLSRAGDRYLVASGGRRFVAKHVVIAMANYQRPHVPAFAGELDPATVQMHSSAYRNPGQLRDGGTLIVGAGNSGSEIAVELARAGRAVWMSGRDTGHIPFRIGSRVGRRILAPVLLRFVFHRVLTTHTPLGRKARPGVVSKGGPLIRVKPKDLVALGVERVGRTAGVRGGKPVLDDGRVLDVANVIWCTGFHIGHSWIDLPGLGAGKEPVHDRGVVASEPGLYFVGQLFLYAMSSSMIHGVGRDAGYIADVIVRRAEAEHGAAVARLDPTVVPARAG